MLTVETNLEAVQVPKKDGSDLSLQPLKGGCRGNKGKQQDRHNCQKAGPATVTRRYFFPQTAACQAFREARGTHSGREALFNWLVEVMVTPDMKRIISWITETCPINTMNNSNTRPPFQRPQDKAHSDKRNICWRRLADQFHCCAENTFWVRSISC